MTNLSDHQLLDLYPKLSSDFFAVSTDILAPKLLGKILVKLEAAGVLAGQITEVEAYTGFNDPADHGYRGRSQRNQSLFLEAGHLYVHRIHRYHCLDIVSDTEGFPGSVLIRSMEPFVGIETMQTRRGKSDLAALLTGPGKICQAFAIDTTFDGASICQSNSQIFLLDTPDIPDSKITRSPRIGISVAKDKLLRYYLSNSRFLSR